MTFRVDIRDEKSRKPTTIAIPMALAETFRSIASADGVTAASLLELALQAYVEKLHPDWAILAPAERAAPRRGMPRRAPAETPVAAPSSEPAVEEEAAQ